MKNFPLLALIGIILSALACGKDCDFPKSYQNFSKSYSRIQYFILNNGGTPEEVFPQNGINGSVMLDSLISESRIALIREINFETDKRMDGVLENDSVFEDRPYLLFSDSLVYTSDTGRFLGILKPDCQGLELCYLAVGYSNHAAGRALGNYFYATYCINPSLIDNVKRIFAAEKLTSGDTLAISLASLKAK